MRILRLGIVAVALISGVIILGQMLTNSSGWPEKLAAKGQFPEQLAANTREANFELRHMQLLQAEVMDSDMPARPPVPNFRALLDNAYAFTALGPLESITRSEGSEEPKAKRETTLRIRYADAFWETVLLHGQKPTNGIQSRKNALVLLGGTKSTALAAMDLSSPDFMNQLSKRALQHDYETWFVPGYMSLDAAAEANAKLTMLGYQLDGVRARAVCDLIAHLRQNFSYEKIRLWGVRDGGRIAEIVNALCGTPIDAVVVDALAVPLEREIRDMFLGQRSRAFALLQTVGPFWGKHSWIDFPLAARNPTVYFLGHESLERGKADFERLALGQDAEPRRLERSAVMFAPKIVQFSTAEFTALDSVLNDKVVNATWTLPVK